MGHCGERVEDRALRGFHRAEEGGVAEAWGGEGEDGSVGRGRGGGFETTGEFADEEDLEELGCWVAERGGWNVSFMQLAFEEEET